MSLFSRLFDSFRANPRPDPLAAIQPRVTPDPQHVGQLAKRFSELAYEPANGFERDRQQAKSNVVQFKRRAR